MPSETLIKTPVGDILVTNLTVKDPDQTTPANAADDVIDIANRVSLSVDLEFVQPAPLTPFQEFVRKLLLNLPLSLKVDYAIEGFGNASAETVISAPVVNTQFDKLSYPSISVDFPATNLGVGFYKAAALVTVIAPNPFPGPATFTGAVGHLSEVIFSIYQP